MNFPFNDDYMKYDYTHHRYVLTPKACEMELGLNLDETLDATGDCNPSTMAERVLNMISSHFYAWVYAHGTNKRYVEYVLAKMPECREIIQECLLNEVYYAMKNGDFWNYADNPHGIEKSVSEATKLTLSTPLSNGFRVLYQGGYTAIVPCEKYRKDY